MKPNFLQTAYQVSSRHRSVMLQNNALSGWLMLAGICLCSWQMGLWALGGLAVSTLSACAFGYSKEAIRNGLFGFNGLLVGLAAALFLQPGFMAVCPMIAASVLSTVITHLFSLQHKLAGYTAPFILAVWILLALCHTFLPSCLQPTAESLSTTAPLQLLPSLCHSLGRSCLWSTSQRDLFSSLRLPFILAHRPSTPFGEPCFPLPCLDVSVSKMLQSMPALWATTAYSVPSH